MSALTDFQGLFTADVSRNWSMVAPFKQVIIDLAGWVFRALYGEQTAIAVDTTLTAADTNKVFFVTADAKVITLPATVAGLKYTFINAGADGAIAINVSPAAADAIHGTTNASTNVVLSGVDNKDAINTKATATTGDYITIVGDGSVGWYVVGCGGIWASEG